LVHALLPGDEADVLRPDPLTEATMSLLREHAQRAGVHAGPLLGELSQRRMGLPRVRRPQMRDDTLGCQRAGGERDRDPPLGLLHLLCGPSASAVRAARPLLAATCGPAAAHELRLLGRRAAPDPTPPPPPPPPP